MQSDTARAPAPFPVFGAATETIFETMSLLARAHDAVNLGQGFPDHGEPEALLRIAADALLQGPNQYPPMRGLPELRRAVAAHAARFQGVTLDPDREVLVTSGATEALADALLAWCKPGDEIVLFEPLYDAYAPMARRAGAVPRFVRLEPPHWTLTREALAAAITDRTRAILLNNPMNPTGKLWRDAELDLIAEQAEARDLIVIADEVYEHIVFDGARFRTVLAHPQLRDRAVRIGSAGKSFSLTGWKVGYAQAAPAVLEPIVRCHQFQTFTTPPNLQRAVAAGLELDDAFFGELTARMQAKRDRFAAGLRRLGFEPLPAEGAYFVCARFEQIRGDLGDFEFCRWITEEARVAAIPLSAFYDSRPRTDLVRFCIATKDEVLDEALARLTRFV
jgi:aspartate/methionine/tyrosine aminotransferase